MPRVSLAAFSKAVWISIQNKNYGLLNSSLYCISVSICTFIYLITCTTFYFVLFSHSNISDKHSFIIFTKLLKQLKLLPCIFSLEYNLNFTIENKITADNRGVIISKWSARNRKMMNLADTFKGYTIFSCKNGYCFRIHKILESTLKPPHLIAQCISSTHLPRTYL